MWKIRRHAHYAGDGFFCLPYSASTKKLHETSEITLLYYRRHKNATFDTIFML